MEKITKVILLLIFIVLPLGYAGDFAYNRLCSLAEPIEVESGESPLVSINYEHHEMHEGHHYFIKTWIFDDNGAGNINYFSFTTPATETRIHAKTILFADTDIVFNIYENCTITDGVAVMGWNNDRDSANTAELIALAAPTVVDVGNLMFSGRTGGGRDAVGVSLSGNYEIIAATNETYCFEIVKQTTADTVIDIDFFWYEDDQPHN